MTDFDTEFNTIGVCKARIKLLAGQIDAFHAQRMEIKAQMTPIQQEMTAVDNRMFDLHRSSTHPERLDRMSHAPGTFIPAVQAPAGDGTPQTVNPDSTPSGESVGGTG